MSTLSLNYNFPQIVGYLRINRTSLHIRHILYLKLASTVEWMNEQQLQTIIYSVFQSANAVSSRLSDVEMKQCNASSPGDDAPRRLSAVITQRASN